MNVLIACESSGIIRNAFSSRGHNAWSCDLKPSLSPGNHIQDDVLKHLVGWDLIIAHPPCTFLCVSGNKWFTFRYSKQYPTRELARYKALLFVKSLASAPVYKFCLENPIGVLSSVWRKPNQIIQPYHFGHDAAKSTCLWLHHLPKLKPTLLISPSKPGYFRETGIATKRYANQTPVGANCLPPSPFRSDLRSISYSGIADAMADQWG